MKTARSLYTDVGLQVHFLVLFLSVASLGGIWLYWLLKYRQSIQRTKNWTPQATYSDNFGVLLFGKSCQDGIDGCLLSRIERCQKLLTFSPKTLVLSGGGEPSEARIMQEYFKTPMPDTCVVLEEKSTNTIENFALSKDYLQNQHVLLVSSCYHMRRIEVLATQFVSSYDCIQAPTPTPSMVRHILEAFYAGWLEIGIWWSKKTSQTHRFLLVDASHLLAN